ncbi:MAG: hypothetical protein KKE02_23970 [Alphaproteobacteria bacterium]|nr:hypothetical protein [Alphaproteobacteria bacterium]MBU1516571.1 hypothetical protein [Alphaproteobacteria bacterium]MBU2094328.1 hypothetical protein [Alphaproteobacteria bacterium]MBU2154095.1 hypothetical protein [Alphaproteobacteria bacterium]MBU2307498.1 hypothetical protein [Alphaproteobacteria bacterium]
MAAEPANVVTPDADARSIRKGDIPDALRRRYLTDTRGGAGIGYFVDTTVTVAAFRDHGRRLTATRTQPQVVRDLVAIARHRDWKVVRVQGAPEFRRDIWISGSLAGLEVRGYRPTQRDLQDLARRKDRHSSASPARHVHDGRIDHERMGPDGAAVQANLKVVEAVVRNRIVEPAEQARVMAKARERIAGWLDRGAHPNAPRFGPSDHQQRERHR